MNIEECIETFSAMMEGAFVRKNKLAFNFLTKVQARYSTAALAKCVRGIIEDKLGPGAKLKGSGDPDCRVQVVICI